MTYIVPYSFVPGTKAKADEVNANFIYLTNGLDDTNDRIDTCNTSISTVQDNLDNNCESLTSEISQKANSVELDGNWTYKYLKLFTNANLYHASNSNATYSLSGYLPAGGGLYQIALRGSSATGTTSGNYAPLYLLTDWTHSSTYAICNSRTRTASTMESAGSMIVLASSYIALYRRNGYAGTATVELLGYRKVR